MLPMFRFCLHLVLPLHFQNEDYATQNPHVDQTKLLISNENKKFTLFSCDFAKAKLKYLQNDIFLRIQTVKQLQLFLN